MLFLARYITPEHLGIYGLMTATINLSLYLLGMDFYVYNTREILARKNGDFSKLIRDQFIFHGILYVFILPIFLLLFIVKLLSWDYVLWFYGLLVLEHLSQEVCRLFITLSRPVLANCISFLRSGVWVYAVIVAVMLNEQEFNLKLIWLCWSIAALLSLIISAYFLRDIITPKIWKQSIDWEWIRRGINISMPFFLSTVALKSMEFADRYFLKFYHGESEVGIYTFYFGITNVVQLFVFAGVTSILYPKIVVAYQENNVKEYKYAMGKMAYAITLSSLVLAFIAGIGMFPVLSLIGREIYVKYLPAYWILLFSTVINSLAQIPHYALYVRRMDKSIIFSTVIALGVVLIANSVLVPKYHMVGAAISTLLGMMIIGLLKSIILMAKGNSYQGE